MCLDPSKNHNKHSPIIRSTRWRLVLQLEVSQLEGSLQQPKAQSSMSPYLVPDTAALCQHLNLIRQLAGSGCFIIIIPRTGACVCVCVSYVVGEDSVIHKDASDS